MNREDRVLTTAIVGAGLIVFLVFTGIGVSKISERISQHRGICQEYGTTYYEPAHACLTTYGALIVPKEFQ